MEQYLGIDVGGTNVKMGIVDATDGRISNFYSHDTASWRSSGHFIERLGDAIALQLVEYPEVKRVGIGVPGLTTRDRTTLIEITAIPEIDGIAIVPDLKLRFPEHDFYLENDANAAALGEYYFGEDKLPEDYIFVTLGTGIGGAAIIDKKVFKGGGGNAMEPGHVPSKNGKVLERNIGKKELLDLAITMRTNYTGQTQLPSDGTISTTGLVAAASKGDELAMQVFQEMGYLLGEGLVSMIRILDITTILIGGGISASFEYILPAINERFEYWLTPYYLKTITIKRATLANDAGLLGAASLCFD
ncbi:ROK family protein [Dyadobacter fanqingshengii]|uniref:ROK family protein n=1 Tax=Dyadobacter fanqingshengii TaxID=2906443 RepID=A0A9X1PEA8_9BACT|nr:ROK family protein [Dyadobacter fanqingshengii]MCF0043621.1 ROK family protein [Dyadobacter fanqingshengii]MCF2504030.1 ROK family protein [Dyadobacter fanqingshengii]USJ34763.1 ROK family protein [Dyadobacter fanqingshengii]